MIYLPDAEDRFVPTADDQIELEPGIFTEIPITEDATITNLSIIPGKNIQIDILYDGDIKTKEHETYDFIDVVQSYPCKNPIINSELQKKVDEGHYRFQTQYSKKKNQLPTIDQVLSLTAKDYKTVHDIDPKIVSQIISGNDLEQSLINLYSVVRSSMTGQPVDDEDTQDFEFLLDEYQTDGLPGDCKSISTFTAGLLNSIGLQSRCIEAEIFFEEPRMIYNQHVDSWWHQYAEAFIPEKQGGFWLPIDPAEKNIFEFPKHTYAFSDVRLPIFENPDSTAKIKIEYV